MTNHPNVAIGRAAMAPPFPRKGASGKPGAVQSVTKSSGLRSSPQKKSFAVVSPRDSAPTAS